MTLDAGASPTAESSGIATGGAAGQRPAPPAPDAEPQRLPLSQAQPAQAYRVLGCGADERTCIKLETLGLVPGGRVAVISNTRSGLILDVRRSRLAVGYDLARLIEVSPVAPGGGR